MRIFVYRVMTTASVTIEIQAANEEEAYDKALDESSKLKPEDFEVDKRNDEIELVDEYEPGLSAE